MHLKDVEESDNLQYDSIIKGYFFSHKWLLVLRIGILTWLITDIMN